jgi:hypothetical protein
VIELGLAVGTGVALGWILRDFLGRKKLDPNILQGAMQQIDQVRGEYQGLLASERDARERDREAFQSLLVTQTQRSDYWAQLAHQSGRRKTKGGQEPSPIPFVPEETDIAAAVRLATQGEGGKDALRNILVEQKGLTPDEADAIIAGDYERLPPGEKLDLFVGEALRQATGVT